MTGSRIWDTLHETVSSLHASRPSLASFDEEGSHARGRDKTHVTKNSGQLPASKSYNLLEMDPAPAAP